MNDPDPPGVRYEWPPGGVHPFDVEPAETCWFIYPGHWGRGWPAGQDRAIGWGNDELLAVVPMGYKQMFVVERLAVVRAGEVLRTWPPTSFVPGAYVRPEASTGDDRFHDLDAALKATRATGDWAMVKRNVADIGWH